MRRIRHLQSAVGRLRSGPTSSARPGIEESCASNAASSSRPTLPRDRKRSWIWPCTWAGAV